MEVGVIGAGRIGVVLTGLLGAAGHDVLLANSRDPSSLRLTLTHMAASVRAVDVDTAAQAKDVVVLAIPFHRYHQLPFKTLAGRVVLDATNYAPARDGAFPYLDDGSTTSSETLAAFLQGARVVKGLNTIHWRSLEPEAEPPGPGRRAIPIAGDDAAATATVAALLDSIGFDSVLAGPLAAGRDMQPGSAVYGPRLTAAELSSSLHRHQGGA